MSSFVYSKTSWIVYILGKSNEEVKFKFKKITSKILPKVYKSLPKDIHHLLKRIKVSISALMKKEYERTTIGVVSLGRCCSTTYTLSSLVAIPQMYFVAICRAIITDATNVLSWAAIKHKHPYSYFLCANNL